MIDFHSHILPCIDDGSSSVHESLDMLRESWNQGVRQIVATPHFYATREDPEKFLQRRAYGWEELSSQLPEEVPEIFLGAEVYYFNGISNMEELPRLCIGSSNILMLEMPFRRWAENIVEEVFALAQDPELTVMLAHIDRYLSTQPAQIWDALEQNGVLFQVNASAFLEGWVQRRKVLRLLEKRQIAAIGSDCHNMDTRSPNMKAGFDMICKKTGRWNGLQLIRRSKALLR